VENLVLIKHFKNWGLEEKMVLELAQKVLKEKGFRENVELSINFVGRKVARDLNLDYRKMGYIPMSSKKDADGKIRLGDIVICTQKLKYEVKFQKSNLDTVLYSWLVHGVDNLLK
jgi:ssRNA-specific RNase YbeY (16S rRNA maturation enzyme)